jgi:hypothetical protein
MNPTMVNQSWGENQYGQLHQTAKEEFPLGVAWLAG